MTTFDVVEDRALTIIDDYKLDKLFQLSEEQFNTFCDGLLIKAAGDFIDCVKSLDYDEENRQFTATLDNNEINILANYFVITWWERETNVASQIALKLKTNNTFAFNSEAQNFKEKQNIIDKLREEQSRRLNEYLALHLNSFM